MKYLQSHSDFFILWTAFFGVAVIALVVVLIIVFYKYRSKVEKRTSKEPSEKNSKNRTDSSMTKAADVKAYLDLIDNTVEKIVEQVIFQELHIEFFVKEVSGIDSVASGSSLGNSMQFKSNFDSKKLKKVADLAYSQIVSLFSRDVKRTLSKYFTEKGFSLYVMESIKYHINRYDYSLYKKKLKKISAIGDRDVDLFLSELDEIDKLSDFQNSAKELKKKKRLNAVSELENDRLRKII